MGGALEKYAASGLLAETAIAQVIAAKVRGEIDRWVVIKRPWPTVLTHQIHGQDFVAEMNRVGRLAHDNITPILDAGFDIEDGGYVVSPYFPGETFAEVVSRFNSFGRIMRAELAAYIAAGISDALEYAYAFRGPDGRPEHIVHGNLGPETVMVTYAGTVKLVDLGLEAALPLDRIKSAITGGELAYSAPERVRGDGRSHAGDLFSVGVILWEAMAGRPLFRGRDAQHTRELLRECRVPPIRDLNPDVPPDFAAIIARLVAKLPGDRYPNAYELGRDLRRFLAARAPTLSSSELGRIMRESFVERSHLLDPSERIIPGASMAIPGRLDAVKRQIESEAATEDIPALAVARNSWEPRPLALPEGEVILHDRSLVIPEAETEPLGRRPPIADREPQDTRALAILDRELQDPRLVAEPIAQMPRSPSPQPRAPSFSKVYSEPTIPRRSLTPTTSELPSARQALGPPPGGIPLALMPPPTDPSLDARPMEAAWTGAGSEPIDLRGVNPWWQSWQLVVGMSMIAIAIGVVALVRSNPGVEPIPENSLVLPVEPPPSPSLPAVARSTPEPSPSASAVAPSVSPTPEPSQAASPAPIASASPSAPAPAPGPSSKPSATPEPTREPAPSRGPAPSQSPAPRREPAPSRTATPDPIPSPSASASPSPTAAAQVHEPPPSPPPPKPEEDDEDMNLGASLSRDGAAALAKGDLAQAERLIADCIEYGGRPECHRYQGQLFEAKKDPARAKEAYQRYLKASPHAADRAAIEAKISAL